MIVVVNVGGGVMFSFIFNFISKINLYFLHLIAVLKYATLINPDLNSWQIWYSFCVGIIYRQNI